MGVAWVDPPGNWENEGANQAAEFAQWAELQSDDVTTVYE